MTFARAVERKSIKSLFFMFGTENIITLGDPIRKQIIACLEVSIFIVDIDNFGLLSVDWYWKVEGKYVNNLYLRLARCGKAARRESDRNQTNVSIIWTLWERIIIWIKCNPSSQQSWRHPNVNCIGRRWNQRWGLSRNKVSVLEGADGSPPF